MKNLNIHWKKKLPSADVADVADIMKKRSMSSRDLEAIHNPSRGCTSVSSAQSADALIVRNGEFRLPISFTTSP
jgi:hypothetical protein